MTGIEPPCPGARARARRGRRSDRVRQRQYARGSRADTRPCVPKARATVWWPGARGGPITTTRSTGPPSCGKARTPGWQTGATGQGRRL